MGLSPLLDETYFQNFLETLLGCLHTNSKLFWISCRSVSLLVFYFLAEIRQIWDYLQFWTRYLSEIFLRNSQDIGSLVFTLPGWAGILTFEFLCAGLNFETTGLVTFWYSGGQLLRPLVLLVYLCLNYLDFSMKYHKWQREQYHVISQYLDNV